MKKNSKARFGGEHDIIIALKSRRLQINYEGEEDISKEELSSTVMHLKMKKENLEL